MSHYCRLLALLVLTMLPLPAQAIVRFTMTEGTARTLNLGVQAANVFVANPNIADVYAASPNSIFVSAVRPGRTTIVAADAADNTIATYEVVVVPENSAAAAALVDGLSITNIDNFAEISGSAHDMNAVQSAGAARRIMEQDGRIVVDNTTYSGPNQVALRVRFVEASRQDLNQLGLNLSALGNPGGNALRVVTGLGDASGFINNTSAPGGPAVGYRGRSGAMTLDGMIDALESRGLVQILSEPTLTTVSGKRANFRAGGEIAYPVAQRDGVMSAAFREYGVSIDFLPVILPNNRISIEVAPEVSFIDDKASVRSGDFVAPGLSIRRAETTVELSSGQTFAIAGLYEQMSTQSQTGVPGLSRVFGSRKHDRNERELMIFITPYLSGPSDAAQPRQPRPPVQAGVGFIAK